MKTSKGITPLVVLGLIWAVSPIAAQAQEKTEEKRPERRGPQRERPAQPAQPQAAPQQRSEPQQRTEPRREAPAQVQRSAPQEQRRERPEQTQPRRENRPVERQAAPPEQPRREVPQQQPVQRQAAPPEQQQPRREAPAQVYQPRPNRPENREPSVVQPRSDPGRTFGNPGGRPAAEAPRAPAMNARPTGQAPRTFTTRTGDVIHRDSGGEIRQVRTNSGTVVYRPQNAPRRVEVVRPGGRVVVASGPSHGYVQRPVVFRNTTIIKRTYIYNGVPQARIYRPRMYNGINLVVYTPVRYYRPAFYTWAYNPWPRPIAYSWGWRNRPWYGYYGGYFTPYPVYASPALWLTDFMIAAMLENAYEERMANAAYAANQYQGGDLAPMTPEVKQAISDEVRYQIERERAEGQNPNSFDNGPDAIAFADNTRHVFVANTALTVDSNRGECSLREGDVIQMNGPPRQNAAYADLVVLSSRGQDCPKGSTVSVGLQDLQEMQNQMRATLDRGMSDLQSKQGQDGLPALPQGSEGTIDSPWAAEARPDSDISRELAEASREGDAAERQADQSAPPVLTLGMTLDEVKTVQGDPQKIVDLGDKKMYVYKDLKITFLNGKVTDIQ